MGTGFLPGAMRMFWNYIVVMTAQPYEETKKKTTKLCIFKWWVLWHMNYISI